MPAKVNLIGRRFGLLTVIQEDGRRASSGGVVWLCSCQCGSTTRRNSASLKLGRATSCGCAKLSRTHGQSKSPLYKRWQLMLRRTDMPSHVAYARYGGRGIKVCERWRNSFEAFAEDMGPSFSPDLTLDRIDVDGDYEPSNCRWATPTQQARNTRRTRRLTLYGYTKTIPEWAEDLGIEAHKIRSRIVRFGWSVERALTTGADPEALGRLADPDVRD